MGLQSETFQANPSGVVSVLYSIDLYSTVREISGLVIGSSFRHLQWDISFLKDNPIIRSREFGITKAAKNVDYSTRLLRYWFGYHLLQKEFEKRGQPLNIAEIGVDTGQLLLFVKSALLKMEQSHSMPLLEWKKWTAFDVILPKERLFTVGYTECSPLELQDGDCQAVGEYDVVILLHVLEHLFEPEEALQKIAVNLRPGAIVIGGFPVHFDLLVPYRQEHIRKSARSMGHVSVFSPERVIRMAKAVGLELEFLTGAFFCRWKGARLENSPTWLRFNLAWGSWFSSWPGEVYWQMRKIV